MVSHTVIDLNGIVRHYYDAHDAADVARAEKQFYARARENILVVARDRCGRIAVARSFNSGAEEHLFLKLDHAGRRGVGRPLRRLLHDCARELRSWHSSSRPGQENDDKEVLRKWLSPQQRKQFDATMSFEVVGSDSGNRYRLRSGAAMEFIEVGLDGHLHADACSLSFGRLPAGYAMLAHKIALEFEEGKALSAARRTSVHIPPARCIPVLFPPG
jgi:hypothetical protein